MPRTPVGNAIISVELSMALRAVTLGKLQIFWKNYLRREVELYFFMAAINRKPVKEEVLVKIKEAYTRHIKVILPAIESVSPWSVFFEDDLKLKQ